MVNGGWLALGGVALASALAVLSNESRAPSWDRLSLLRGGVLLTPDGPLRMDKIGQGAFATVYREAIGEPDRMAPGRVIAVVAEGVWDKQIAADAHKLLPDNPHLPAVERLGTLTDGRTVYAMPFYQTPYRSTLAHPRDRASFRAIEACAGSLAPRRGESGFDAMNRGIACMESAKVDPQIVEAVEVLVALSPEYSDQYDMEFSPRNAATDAQGNLILLDLLFDRRAVRRKRVEKLKRQREKAW